ncbi:ABC transporter ATP-binding protein [Nocardioides hungaricus]
MFARRPSSSTITASSQIRGDLEACGVEFAFGAARSALGPLDLTFVSGSHTAIAGPSGSGKSTLLQLLAGILTPAKGLVRIGDTALSELDQDARARVRLQHFGMVFQFAELLPELTIAENIGLPTRLLGQPEPDDAIEAILGRLQIAHVADQLPSQVSGGERQRAAIARAVVHRPAVIFADEPTGALDRDNGEVVLSLLLDVSRQSGSTLIVVTHDVDVASRLDETVQLRDGMRHELT